MCSGLIGLEEPPVGLLEIKKLGGVFVTGEQKFRGRINFGLSEKAAEVDIALL